MSDTPDSPTLAAAAGAAGPRPAGSSRQHARQDAEACVLPDDRPYQERLQAVQAAACPLLEAARPLLRALADMPVQLTPQQGWLLRRLLDREVVRFHSLCGDAGIRQEHGVAASYALCTALDEAAASTDWGRGGPGDVGLWSADLLAVRFHGDNKGGDKVFLLLGRLSASPEQHIDLIELLSTILGLGFEGRYGAGGSSDARRQLDLVRHRLSGLLAAARGEVPPLLSPHGRGQPGGAAATAAGWRGRLRRARVFRPLRTIPFGWTCALYIGVLAGLFVWQKALLDQRATAVLVGIQAIGTLQPAAARPAARPRLKALLQAEIDRGWVRVDEQADHSAVSFSGDGMFLAGQARLSPALAPVLAKLGQELKGLPGAVQVTGHSDDQPIRTREFPDNQQLSLRRAQAVATALREAGVEAGRLRVAGLGDSRPIADNQSVAGRARNRRVDVVLQSE